MNKGFKRFFIPCFVFILIFIGFDIYSHSSIERVIRTDLFMKGYYIKSFKTEVLERAITDPQYGTKYYCINPAIGPDSYDIDSTYKCFGKLKYFYINWAGTGGG